MIPRTVRAWSSRFGDLLGHRQHRAAAPHRGAALRGRRCQPLNGASRDRGNPVRRRHQPAWAGRRRHQDGPRAEPDARGDDQPGLRPGRGRPGRGQPDGVRDALPREAAVLPRRRATSSTSATRTSTTRAASARGRSGRPPATTSTIRRPPRSSPPPSSPAGCRRRPRSGSLTAVTDEETAEVATPGRRRHARDRRGAAHLSRRRPRAAGVRLARLHRRPHRQRHAPRPRRGQPAGRPLHPKCARASAGNTLLRFKGGEYEFRAVGRRVVPERIREVDGTLAAIELALRAASRPRLCAARSDAAIARAAGPRRSISTRPAAGTGCGASTPRSTPRTSKSTTSRS